MPKAATTARGALTTLTVLPKTIAFHGKYTEARVLVEGRGGKGRIRDLSDEVRLTVSDPKVAAVGEDGILRPVGDGRTTVSVKLGVLETRIPITVKGVTKSGPPQFYADVIPVLTKAGCNMGACHGAAQGKGGFKLSLQGYDPEPDYEVITRGASGRRIARSQPDNSLLLRKATMQVGHKGGIRFKAGSPEYRLLRDWIVGGMPGYSGKEAKVTQVEVVPPAQTLSVGQQQRFAVRAHYSDGTVRDVTSQAQFTASDGTVASVTPGGLAKATGVGEGAVLVRYQSLVAVAHVLSPFAAPKPAPNATATARSEDRIDNLIERKLAALGLDTSRRSSDADFIRRATLDVIGVLPTPAEARAFLADKRPDKRERLIEALLDRPEYVDFWTLKWGDILRSTRSKLTEKGMYAFNFWLRRSVAENKPWDKFAREVLLARGSAYEDGPANFFRSATTPQELAEATSQVFLGVRIQCAKCHNHPYEKWTQNQYYEMAAFFARVRAKDGERPGERVIFASNGGEVNHPKTQKQMTPCALDANPVAADFQGDRREALANWLTSPKNPFFAKILVNRVWRHYMGKGLVEPVDDMRLTNPPANAELLDFLAQDFVRHGFDLKTLMRTIMRTKAYQRTAEPTQSNSRDNKYYSHYLFKRLSAEQLMDALSTAIGVSDKFDGFPTGTRAAQLPDAAVGSYFLDLFGRPARNFTCECERIDDPNLGQVLHLMNNAGINGRLGDKNGRIAQLIAAKASEKRIVQELYLAAYSRYPTAAESKQATILLALSPDRQRAAEDILWALLNAKEFLFNH